MDAGGVGAAEPVVFQQGRRASEQRVGRVVPLELVEPLADRAEAEDVADLVQHDFIEGAVVEQARHVRAVEAHHPQQRQARMGPAGADGSRAGRTERPAAAVDRLDADLNLEVVHHPPVAERDVLDVAEQDRLPLVDGLREGVPLGVGGGVDEVQHDVELRAGKARRGDERRVADSCVQLVRPGHDLGRFFGEEGHAFRVGHVRREVGEAVLVEVDVEGGSGQEPASFEGLEMGVQGFLRGSESEAPHPPKRLRRRVGCRVGQGWLRRFGDASRWRQAGRRRCCPHHRRGGFC